MIWVVAVGYALEFGQCVHKRSHLNLVESSFAFVWDPVGSFKTLITIWIQLSVFNLLALDAILLAIIFIGFALHVVKRSGICAINSDA
jgi:hypothetical protein